jgi:hypothetical protein
MQRRTFLGTALVAATASPLFAALREERWDDAAEVLSPCEGRRFRRRDGGMKCRNISAKHR